MKKASFGTVLPLGITLFSMFFGAGNLIFAPFMGAQAGEHALWALAGFLVTGAVLPVASVVVGSWYKNGVDLVKPVHPLFAVCFVTLVYLLIGPCIAIPRTASTSFAMLKWLFGTSMVWRLVFTVVFFGLAALAASRPGKLQDILGRFSGPALVVLVLLVCGLALVYPVDVPVHKALGYYQRRPVWEGFMAGYQTMDLLAGFCMATVVRMNVEQAGFREKRERNRVMVWSALICAVLLGLMYGLLCLAGMKYSGRVYLLSNGAEILSAIAYSLFGRTGEIVLSLIFLLACFNVCSGLLSCCAEYFAELTKKGTYLNWLVLFAVVSGLLSILGLDSILAISAPILAAVCPVALVLLAMGAVRYLRKQKEPV